MCSEAVCGGLMDRGVQYMEAALRGQQRNVICKNICALLIEIDYRRWSKRCPSKEDQHKKTQSQFVCGGRGGELK